MLTSSSYKKKSRRTFLGAQEFLSDCFEEATGALLETLWPTRCAICDLSGEVLCERCRRLLSFVDFSRACSCCGAPFGAVQCSECNSLLLREMNLEQMPFNSCSSALVFDDSAARLVTVYKDQGEQRLANELASLMAPLINPRLLDAKAVVAPIPATISARRKRGFDHGELLATKVAQQVKLPFQPLFLPPKNKDQRAFSRHERFANMQGGFRLIPGVQLPSQVLLVDDVFTTGATLIAASQTLRSVHVAEIHCLTVARVW